MADRRLIVLGCLLAAAAALFLFWGLRGPTAYILELRLVKLAALLAVGASAGVATVLFQTISQNRILTPSIMGFDALFLLLQTGLVAGLGAAGASRISGLPGFALETAVMLGAALVLFSSLLSRTRHDIKLMVLAGVVLGVMFRTLTAFLQRLMEPSEFTMVEARMFAQFSGIDRSALVAGLGLMALAALWLVRHHRVLDVAALGRSPARSLGVAYDGLQLRVLCLIAALVSVATALVGPLAFLGLLVTSLAHSLMQSHRHALLLPAAALIGALILVAGQTVFERLLHLQSTLAVVIEFCGGLLFLVLLVKGKIR
ncbi:iron chelate uptake ABC transporter family permease subunit (plasmid) [Leisingera sp. S132]|uniref:iron chelate uptake ABC transporter family permease subunit n=1 Tax=Leisingera sp. S132 TaxID=2867016 RepID=UPI0021A871DB|nr:iron chelate uptake ABC transporter family permease subunit [Leisingera sp. S132]UWQ81665.1 iron chelate uptake ABC transporter family permease subunit [Leisingera sp. S132]